MKFPSYRRHTSGQARVTIAGKDYLLGSWKSKESKEKYDRLVGEYISSGRSKSFGTKPAELSIAELLVAFKAQAAQTYGVSKRGEYYHHLLARRPLKRLYSSTQAIADNQSYYLHEVVGGLGGFGLLIGLAIGNNTWICGSLPGTNDQQA